MDEASDKLPRRQMALGVTALVLIALAVVGAAFVIDRTRPDSDSATAPSDSATAPGEPVPGSDSAGAPQRQRHGARGTRAGQ